MNQCLLEHNIHAIGSFVIRQHHDIVLRIGANVTLNGDGVAHIIGNVCFECGIDGCHETGEALLH